jgi:hypothetical protein
MSDSPGERGPRGQLAAPLLRDRPPSPFANILASFLEVHPRTLVAVFVDGEGECVDYASRLDPFEALVLGAQLLPLTLDLAVRMRKQGGGALVSWMVEAEGRDLVVRRVTEDHSVIVALAAGAVSARLLRALSALAEALRREAGFDLPSWDPWGEGLEVETRPAAGWGYAPCRLTRHDGQTQPLEVLGRWSERGSISAQDVVCFRVRAGEDELTLAHDRSLDRWHRR